MVISRSSFLYNDCLSNVKTVFNILSKEEIDMLFYDNSLNKYKRGNILYQEGNRMNGLYFICDGIIKQYKTGIEGKEQIVKFAHKGDIIGYRSVLSGENACTSAKVIQEASMYFIPSEILVALIKTNSNFSLRLMQLICSELGEANEFITDIAQKTVRERLAEVLVHLITKFGLDDEKLLNISLTREEMANIVGTATESVIRLLSEFKEDKLIEIAGRRIKILNINGLKKTGNLYHG